MNSDIQAGLDDSDGNGGRDGARDENGNCDGEVMAMMRRQRDDEKMTRSPGSAHPGRQLGTHYGAPLEQKNSCNTERGKQ